MRTDCANPVCLFVVRAADYYGVSCDYLLGRSMARDGSAVPAERMEGTATEMEHSQIVQAAALLLQVAESLESKQLSHEIESYFAVAIYKVYRYLYMADPAGGPGWIRGFPPPGPLFDLLGAPVGRGLRKKSLLRPTSGGGWGLPPEQIPRSSPLSRAAILTVFPRICVPSSLKIICENFRPTPHQKKNTIICKKNNHNTRRLDKTLV